MITHYLIPKKNVFFSLCLSVLVGSTLCCAPRTKAKEETVDIPQVSRFQGNFRKMHPVFRGINMTDVNQPDSEEFLTDLAFRPHEVYKIGDYFKANHHVALAKMEAKKGHCVAALAHFKTAIQRDAHKENMAFVSILHKGLADAYACSEQRDSAVFFYNQALTTPDLALQADIYTILTEIYSNAGDYARALTCEQKNRELYNHTVIEKKEKVVRTEAKHEYDKAVSNLDGKVWKLKLLILALLLAGVSGVAAYAVENLTRRKGYAQEKRRVEIHTRWQSQILMEARENLAKKEVALTASQQLIDLKNNFIDSLQNDIEHQVHAAHKEIPNVNIQELQNIEVLTKEDWLNFRGRFDVIFPGFTVQLRQQYANLTNAERRLLTLIKVGFDTQEVANTLHISIDSVYKSRYRLRKKLNLPDDVDLETFVRTFWGGILRG